jgi:hypothetical protein
VLDEEEIGGQCDGDGARVSVHASQYVRFDLAREDKTMRKNEKVQKKREKQTRKEK